MGYWGRAHRPTDPSVAEAKAIDLNALARIFGGDADPEYPASSFLSHYEHGYSRNELVYACIEQRATSLPDAPLRVYDALGRRGDALENHPLSNLLATPNPLMTDFELDQMLELHRSLAGNAFWEVVNDRAGRPVELWPLRPDLIKIKRGRSTVEYGYSPDGSGDYIKVDVVHFRMVSPLDPLGGMAPMQAALRATALDNEANDFVKALLKNHAIPGVVVTMGTLEDAIDEETTSRLKSRWRQAYGGRSRGEPAFLQTGMDVKTLGHNLRDLEFPDLRTISESRICMAFGVPAIVVGANVGLQRSTFANFAEAKRSFWEESLIPARKQDARTVTLRLANRFAGQGARRIAVRPDWSEVTALKDSEQDRWARATAGLAAGGLTLNDFRREVSLPDVPGGDIFLMPSGVIATRDIEGITERVTGASGATGGDPAPADQGGSDA